MPTKSENAKVNQNFVKAIAFIKRYTEADNSKADQLLEEAWGLDNKYPTTLSWRSYVQLIRFQEAWGTDPDASLNLALSLAQEAVTSDSADYSNQWTLAIVSHAAAGTAQLSNDGARAKLLCDEGNEAFARALQGNPNDADLLVMHADVLIRQENPEVAIRQIETAIAMKQDHPEWYWWSLGSALFHGKRYALAKDKLLKMNNPQPRVFLILAACYARLSEQADSNAEAEKLLDDGRNALKTFRQLVPNWTLSHESKQLFAIHKDSALQDRWIESLGVVGASD